MGSLGSGQSKQGGGGPEPGHQVEEPSRVLDPGPPPAVVEERHEMSEIPEARTRAPEPRTEGPREPRRTPTRHGTVGAERELRAELHHGARQLLGPTATEEEVQKVANDWYDEPPPEPPPETAFERRSREADITRAKADVERYIAGRRDEP